MSTTELSLLPLIQRHYSIEAIAKEPWNKNSVLYVPLESQHLLYGATALASFLYLYRLKVEFNVKYVKNVCEMSPSGKSPLLKCGKYVIGEFEPIVNFCSIKNLSVHKINDNDFKINVKSYVVLIESLFTDTMNYILFKEKSNKESLDDMYRSLYPRPLNIFIYYSDYFFIRNKLKLSKLWDLDKKQILDRFVQTIEALDRKLNKNEFLIDDKLTEADILLYSFLKVIKNYKEYNDINLCLENFNNIKKFYSYLDDNFNDIIKMNYLNKFQN